MIFKLKTAVKDKEIIFKSRSAIVKFIEENDELENQVKDFENEYHLKLNAFQREHFLAEKSSEIIFYNFIGNPDLVFLFKIKQEAVSSVDYFRKSMASVITKLKDLKIDTLHIIIPFAYKFNEAFPTEEYYYRSLIEGVYLGNYSFEHYKSEKSDQPKLSVFFHTTNGEAFEKALKMTDRLMSSVFFSRDLVNEPAIKLTPDELAKRVKSKLTKADIKVTVFDKEELKQKNFDAVLAVGGASIHSPKMIILEYVPRDKEPKKVVLVGKGVTYDSGGLSIKTTEGMVDMKADMGGAATVIGAVLAVAEAKLSVNVIGIIPAVENMVSGNSLKPGDIITTSSGKSIEVKNTDAEGRLILADALEYASSLKPDEIFDFATLTGACVVGLGEFVSGLMTKNDDIAKRLTDTGLQTFEMVWRLPFLDEYKKELESDIADIKNLGSKWGGAITAGKFLEFFVDKEIPWAHVDIAGPSLKNKLTNYTEKWETGFGVRLMFEYLKNL